MNTAISKEHISVFLSLAQAGFAYDRVKELASKAGLELVHDEPELGYARFGIQIFAGEEPRHLVVDLGNDERPPYAFLPLFVFPDQNGKSAEFDGAFQSVAEELVRVIGPSLESGNYGLSHRKWQYSYCWWSLPEAELVLVQDEFDILDGLDVTLWIRSASAPMALPMRP
jgi:hypothetical protein